MGCSQSVEIDRQEKGDGVLLPGEGGGGGGGGVLGANSSGGWYHSMGVRSGRTYAFGNSMCNTASRSCVIAPVERRFVELEPTEWEDAGKRVARFVVTREALGVPAGWVYRVDSLHLVVDGQKWHDAGGGMRLPLRCVLEWVEAPDGDAAAAAARVSGLAIEALLSATGAMPLMTEPYGGAVRFAVYLPFGPHAAGVPLRVRAGLAAGGSGVHLVAAILVAPRGPEGRRVCEFEWNRLFSAPLRIEAGDAAAAGEALVPLDLPSVVTDLLLQAVVVALPFRQIRVHDVALLLDGRELACAPGIAARAAFEMRYTPFTEGGKRLCAGWTYLCLPLAVDFEATARAVVEAARRQRTLCGELDLSTPTVHNGRLAVRVRFECGGCGFTDSCRHALVQACLLRK